MRANTCILTADGARARWFALQYVDRVDGRRQTNLTEVGDAVDPARRQRPSEEFTDTRPGLRAAFAGGPRHGVDDRRDAHVDEDERRFAADVVRETAAVLARLGARRLVVAAPPAMLGVLRQLGIERPSGDINVWQIAKELTNLTPSELHDYLESEELLPAA